LPELALNGVAVGKSQAKLLWNLHRATADVKMR
jgi:hypothetical protein